jgi:hypothetical protein
MPIDTSAVTDGLIDPSSASANGQSVSSRSISELIAGIQFSANATAVQGRRRGLRFSKILNQGPIRPRRGPYYGYGWPNW